MLNQSKALKPTKEDYKQVRKAAREDHYALNPEPIIVHVYSPLQVLPSLSKTYPSSQEHSCPGMRSVHV